MPAHRVLLACLTLAALLYATLTQASNVDLTFGAPAQSSRSSQLPTPDTPTFLPVQQAYQLSANRSDTTPQQLQLHWQIAPAYYLYQHALKVTHQGNPLTIAPPPALRHFDEFLQQDVALYRQTLTLDVTLPAGLSLPAELRVHSQGCADAGLCYPPQIQTLRLSADGQISVLADAPPQPTAATDTPRSTSNPLTLISALLAALLGGVLLNLMPCVFPVLSLKALALARSQQTPHSHHQHGWSYTAGAVLTFVVIAGLMLALRQSGQAIGWGFQLQNPVFVALLAYLFVLMALNLLGFWQFSNRLAGAGQALTEGHSLRASFFTGALATLVASPCTAPFMAGALGYAITQNAAVALLVFAALGFGMALPYLLLTYSPALARRLPKPGPWMETLRQLLAFPLLLTALWLLWVAGRQSGSDGLVRILGGLLALGFGLWLWQHQPRRRWQQALALLTLLAALWPLTQLHTSSAPLSAKADSHWQPYSEQRLQQLLSSGTPVFINLTADWCITCLTNEAVALDTDASNTAFEQAGIVRLKGDWTHYNPEITGLLNRFGRSGVPLYLLYSGQPGAQPVILPQLLRQQTLLDAIGQLKTSK